MVNSLDNVSRLSTALIQHHCVSLDQLKQAVDQFTTFFEGQELRIHGGSVCGILDHIYRREPGSIVLRDLDLAVVMNHCVTQLEIEVLSERIAREVPAIKSCEVELRERTPPDLPLVEESSFSVGLGIQLVCDREILPLIDITFFNHQEDLEELNGLYYQDSVSIILSEKRTFGEFVKRAQECSFSKLIQEGWIFQYPNAYENWTQGKLEIRNWPGIQRRPHIEVIRLVRTLSKRGLLDRLITPGPKRDDLQSQWKDVNQAIASTPYHESAAQARAFERLLRDEMVAKELKALCQTGMFNN